MDIIVICPQIHPILIETKEIMNEIMLLHTGQILKEIPGTLEMKILMNEYLVAKAISNTITPRNNTRELSIHEIDEEDEEWLHMRRLLVQREGNNNNNNNNFIINGNAVNNNA